MLSGKKENLTGKPLSQPGRYDNGKGAGKGTANCNLLERPSQGGLLKKVVESISCG